MPSLVILCGLSFSGKTTLARPIAAALDATVVSYDLLYGAVARDPEIRGVEEWRLVVDAVHEETRRLLESGRNVVVDNLNEDRVDRGWLRDIAEACGAGAVVVHVDTPVEICDARRRQNQATGARGPTSTEQFEFVCSRFERPGRDERSLAFRPEDEVGPWLERLRPLL